MRNSILVLLGLFLGLSAQASRYGEAGCGLGSMVMGAEGNQILAATTNGSSYSNLFGISSGTSNCTDDGAVAEGKQVPLYIEVNKMSLANEAAKGRGETLSGLARIMGCNETSFSSSLKSNYNKIFVETKMDNQAIQTEIQNLVHDKNTNTCGA